MLAKRCAKTVGSKTGGLFKTGVPVKPGVLEDRVATFDFLTFDFYFSFNVLLYAFHLMLSHFKTCILSNVNTCSLSYG